MPRGGARGIRERSAMDRMSQDEFWRRFMAKDAVARREAHARRYVERELEFRDQRKARIAAERAAQQRANHRLLDFAEKVRTAGFHDRRSAQMSQLELEHARQ